MRNPRTSARWRSGRWLALYVGVLLLPLFLESMQRPFLPVDDVTYFGGIAPGGDVLRLASVWPNFLWNLFTSSALVRPIAHFFFNLQFALFHGEFWAFYLVKWITKGLAIAGILQILKGFDVDRWSRRVVAIFLLFHPAMFELRIFASDSWMTLFLVTTLLILVRTSTGAKSIYSPDGFRPAVYLLFLLSYFMMVGSKESAVVFGGCILALGVWGALYSKRRLTGLGLVVPPAGIWCLYVYRIFLQHASERHLDKDVQLLMNNIKAHFRFTFGHSLISLFSFAFCAAVVIALWKAWRDRDLRRLSLLAFCVFSAVALLLLSSIPAVDHPRWAAPRYVVPAVYALAIPLGMGLRRFPAWSKALLVVLIPLWNVGDLYSQSLAISRSARETSDLVNFVAPRLRGGLDLAITGEGFESSSESGTGVGGEVLAAIHSFYGRFGHELYETYQPRLWNFSGKNGPVRSPYLLVSVFGPKELVARKYPGFFEPAWVTRVEQISSTRSGALERLTDFYQKVSHRVGGRFSVFYDDGNLPLLDRPLYYVYTVVPGKSGAGSEQVRLPPTETASGEQRYGAFLR